MKNHLLKNSYTLIEALVAIAIFTICISGPVGLFIASIRGQARALATREIVDSSSYAIEYMSRALRMAKKDLTPTGDCIDFGFNYENPGPPPDKFSKIKFLNYLQEEDDWVCREFSSTTVNQIQEKRFLPGSPQWPLTADDLEVTLLKFKLSGEEQGDDLQPKVTILFVIGKKGYPETRLRVQTTISQRNLDVTY